MLQLKDQLDFDAHTCVYIQERKHSLNTSAGKLSQTRQNIMKHQMIHVNSSPIIVVC